MHKAKKSLGQNFLKSVPALNKIVEAGEVSKEDIILEIGPGKGALTEKLLEKVYPPNSSGGRGCVIAIEADRDLFEFLKTKFEKEINDKKLVLINEDILSDKNFLLAGVSQADEPRGSAPRARGDSDPIKEEFLLRYKIIANIPYNITGAILKKFLTEKNQPERMVLMVQNEVAKRITARDGKESILSVSVKAYGDPKIVMKVPSRYFSPAPKVDSAIISIKNISRKIFIENKIDEEQFWEIIHSGFAHKRKKLSSNLKKIQKYTSLSSINTLENKRAEELSLEDWINLIKVIDINKK